MVDKVIKLSRKYAAHDKIFDRIILREPKSRDYFEIGEPLELHRAPDGSDGRYLVEHLDRIEAYAARLPKEPTAEALVDLDLVDAMALKEAITGFFIEARTLLNASTNSSGAQGSQSQKSES